MKRSSRRQFRPNPVQGFSSLDLNRFRNCSREEIQQLLRHIGYAPASTVTPQATPEQIDAEIKKEARRLLSTAEGKVRLERALDALIAQEARQALRSPAVQARIEQCVAHLAVDQVCERDDLLSRLCAEAVKARVQQWSKSSRGQAAFKRMLTDAANQHLLQESTQKRRSWIEKYLEEHVDADAQSEET